MSLPLLVCIPFWSNDRNQAYDLCKLIAGMQQTPSQEAEFLLVPRQDCVPDKTMEEILSRRFKATSYKCESPLRGWPSGPNGMFGRTMCYLATIGQKYKAIFWMEPDCVPMRRDWIKILSDEWEKRDNNKFIVGFSHQVDPGNPDSMHVNGNSLYDQQIARLLPEITSCDRVAWDWQCRHKMLNHAYHTNVIINKYKATSVTEQEFKSFNQFAVVHGYKIDSLIKLVAGQFQIV